MSIQELSTLQAVSLLVSSGLGFFFDTYKINPGHAVAQSVEALHYKP
jgi:hypothetical protein